MPGSDDQSQLRILDQVIQTADPDRTRRRPLFLPFTVVSKKVGTATLTALARHQCPFARNTNAAEQGKGKKRGRKREKKEDNLAERHSIRSIVRRAAATDVNNKIRPQSIPGSSPPRRKFTFGKCAPPA